jgi:hypothetical protein
VVRTTLWKPLTWSIELELASSSASDHCPCFFSGSVDYIPEGYIQHTSEWNDFIITRATSGLKRLQHPRALQYKSTSYYRDLPAHPCTTWKEKCYISFCVCTPYNREKVSKYTRTTKTIIISTITKTIITFYLYNDISELCRCRQYPCHYHILDNWKFHWWQLK